MGQLCGKATVNTEYSVDLLENKIERGDLEEPKIVDARPEDSALLSTFLSKWHRLVAFFATIFALVLGKKTEKEDDNTPAELPTLVVYPEPQVAYYPLIPYFRTLRNKKTCKDAHPFVFFYPTQQDLSRRAPRIDENTRKMVMDPKQWAAHHFSTWSEDEKNVLRMQHSDILLKWKLVRILEIFMCSLSFALMRRYYIITNRTRTLEDFDEVFEQQPDPRLFDNTESVYEFSDNLLDVTNAWICCPTIRVTHVELYSEIMPTIENKPPPDDHRYVKEVCEIMNRVKKRIRDNECEKMTVASFYLKTVPYRYYKINVINLDLQPFRLSESFRKSLEVAELIELNLEQLPGVEEGAKLIEEKFENYVIRAQAHAVFLCQTHQPVEEKDLWRLLRHFRSRYNDIDY